MSNSTIRIRRFAATDAGHFNHETRRGDPSTGNGDLVASETPYGILMGPENDSVLTVSASRIEGIDTASKFASLNGNGLFVTKGHLNLSGTTLKRLGVGVQLRYAPAEGYQSIHDTRFFACRKGIYASLASQNMDLDLSCSAFDPGDTLPNYSVTPPVAPHFDRQFADSAWGIVSKFKAINNIGRFDTNGYSAGANIFPLAPTTTANANLYRFDLPPTSHDVNVVGSNWLSPVNWTSIMFIPGIPTASPTYVRFRNEFLGRTYPDTSIPHVATPWLGIDANSNNVPLCYQADDTTSFPTRVRLTTPKGLTSVNPKIEGDGHLEISPNPALDEAEVRYSLLASKVYEANLELWNLTETNPLWQYKVSEAKGSVNIDLSNLAPGVYLVRLMQSDQKPLQVRLVHVR